MRTEQATTPPKEDDPHPIQHTFLRFGKKTVGELDPITSTFFCLVWLGAILLRYWHLGEKSFWVDEIITANVCSGTWAQLFDRSNSFLNPPLYYIIAYPFFSQSNPEYWLRLPSFIFGILVFPLFFLLTRSISGKTGGLIATILLAISPFHVYCSQDARAYSFLVFLCVAFYLLFFQAINSLKTGKRQSPWELLGLIVLSSALAYTHYFSTFLLLPSLVFYLIILSRSPSKRRRNLVLNCIALLILGCTLAPAAFTMLKHAGGFTVESNGPLSAFVLLNNAASDFLAIQRPWALLLLTIPFVCVFRFPEGSWYLYYGSILVFTPTAVFSFIQPGHDFLPGRWLFYLFPLAILLLASCINVISRPTSSNILLQILASGIFIGMLIFDLSGLKEYYTYEKTDWRAAAQYLRDTAHDGDFLVAGASGTNASLAFYIARMDTFPTMVPIEHCSTAEDLEVILATTGRTIFFVSSHVPELPHRLLILLSSDFHTEKVFPALHSWGDIYIWSTFKEHSFQ